MIWFSDNLYPKLKKEREIAIKKAENKNKKPPKLISFGQDLWTSQFCHSKYIVEDWMFELIEEVNLSLSANIPIAQNVQECDVLAADYYSIIKEEILFIERF